MAWRGALVKETHDTTPRFAPPLIITGNEIDDAVDHLEALMAQR